MSDPTTNNASAWDQVFAPERGLSHRSTTSSRRPGKAIEGTVSYRVRQIVKCPKCGGFRYDSPHPHAPRWEGTRQVDCEGRPIAKHNEAT